MHKIATATATVLSLLFVTGGVSGNQARDITDVEGCRPIQEDTLRLECFDTVLASGSFAMPDQKEMRARKEKERAETFGKSGLKSAERKRASRSGAEKASGEISMKVVSIIKNNVGHRYFRMENGQVWRIQGTSRFPVKPPFAATVKKGSMGGYFLIAEESGRSVKVKRVK